MTIDNLSHLIKVVNGNLSDLPIFRASVPEGILQEVGFGEAASRDAADIIAEALIVDVDHSYARRRVEVLAAAHPLSPTVHGPAARPAVPPQQIIA